MMVEENKKIILFDGVCNLCNNAVTFVIKRDRKDIFRYAAIQSDIGQKLITNAKINPETIDSIFLISKGKCYYKSNAALRIAKHLSGAYPLLFAFLIVPKFIRNWVYDFIAKNRYKWFGKKESCMIPTPALKSLFIDQK